MSLGVLFSEISQMFSNYFLLESPYKINVLRCGEILGNFLVPIYKHLLAIRVNGRNHSGGDISPRNVISRTFTNHIEAIKTIISAIVAAVWNQTVFNSTSARSEGFSYCSYFKPQRISSF